MKYRKLIWLHRCWILLNIIIFLYRKWNYKVLYALIPKSQHLSEGKWIFHEESTLKFDDTEELTSILHQNHFDTMLWVKIWPNFILKMEHLFSNVENDKIHLYIQSQSLNYAVVLPWMTDECFAEASSGLKQVYVSDSLIHSCLGPNQQFIVIWKY